jgi:hypothetical protein
VDRIILPILYNRIRREMIWVAISITLCLAIFLEAADRAPMMEG